MKLILFLTTFFFGLSSFAARQATLKSATFSPSSVTSGQGSTLTVTLTRGAPWGGALVSLASNTSAVGIPSSVVIPQGSSSARVSVSTSAVSSVTSATISVSYRGLTVRGVLTLNPAAAPSPSPSRDAFTRLEAESPDVNSGAIVSGGSIGYLDNGDYIAYHNVNFDTGADRVEFNLAVDPAYAGQNIEVRLDSATGPLLVSHVVQNTGGWGSYAIQASSLSSIVSGVRSVYVKFVGSGGICNLDMLRFIRGTTPTPAPAPPPTPSSPAVPAAFFGMHIGDLGNVAFPTQIPIYGLRQWDVWLYSPVQDAYLGPTWGAINYARGQYDWALFDTFFKKCNDNNIKEIIFNLGSAPKWVNMAGDSTLPPDNLADWDTWVSVAVRRAKDVHGRTGVHWEIWNEINHTSGSRSHFYNGSWTAMAQMTKRAYNVIKSIDLTAKVLNASVQGNEANILDLYFSADAGGGESATKYIDILNSHHYYGFGGDGPEDYVTKGYYQNYRNLFAKYGLGNKPWWDTESNTYDKAPSEQLHAALMARHWLLNWNEGIQRTYFYAYDYDHVGDLWSGSGTGLNSSGVAYKELHNWMVGSSTAGKITVSGSVWSGTFTRQTPSGYKALVVWNTAGNSSYTVPVGYNSYRNLAGVRTAVPSNRIVTIGVSPLWFENQ